MTKAGYLAPIQISVEIGEEMLNEYYLQGIEFDRVKKHWSDLIGERKKIMPLQSGFPENRKKMREINQQLEAIELKFPSLKAKFF